MTQYVHPSKNGLVRIVKHGRGWRVLMDEYEVGRHACAETALLGARARWPQARIPPTLALWRHLPGSPPLGHRRARSRANGSRTPSRAD